MSAQRSVFRGPARHSLCWVPTQRRGLALLFLLGPGALCVGAWRSLCRVPALFLWGMALSVSGDCRGPTQRALGEDRRAPTKPDRGTQHRKKCTGPWHKERRPRHRDRRRAPGRRRDCRGRTQRALGEDCRAPTHAVTQTPTAQHSLCRASALSFFGAQRLCVGSRRSLCRGPAVSVSGPSALLCPSGLRRAQRSLCPARRSLSRAPALSGRLCVGARRSLCRGPTLVFCSAQQCHNN